MLQGKLSRDIVWTIGSFTILAVSGIIINLVVAGFRDAAALGVFNLTYAVYIVASQIAGMGIQFSVIRHSAYYEADSRERGGMLLTALIMTFGLDIIAAGLLYFSAPFFGRIFNSIPTENAIQYVAFGLLLYPLNKVLIAYLNGMRHMRAFSILQANRYILIMIWVTWISASDQPFELTALGFILAESITIFGAIGYLVKASLASVAHFDATWVHRHFIFGSKSLLAGMFIEMNSRIDVLLLGIFLDERAVGIYSFAAMLVDGLYNVLVMVRINFNPILVATVRDGNWEQGRRLLANAKRYGFIAAGIMSFAVVCVFIVLAFYIIPGKGLQDGISSLLILLTGFTLISAFIPFDNILMVTGYPAYQAFQNFMVVVMNVILNIYLVPMIGIEGAALATSASYLVGIGIIIVLSKRLIGWNLLINMTPR